MDHYTLGSHLDQFRIDCKRLRLDWRTYIGRTLGDAYHDIETIYPHARIRDLGQLAHEGDIVTEVQG
jgi:hypothetical protein